MDKAGAETDASHLRRRGTWLVRSPVDTEQKQPHETPFSAWPPYGDGAAHLQEYRHDNDDKRAGTVRYFLFPYTPLVFSDMLWYTFGKSL